VNIYDDTLNAALRSDPLAPVPVRPSQVPAVPACRCEWCRYGRRPAADAVLYAGPDAVHLLERAAIRDGRYEDIPAGFDAVGARAHVGLNTVERRFAAALAPVWRRIEAHLAEQTMALPRCAA
jgi:hypothetical protein